MQLVGHERQVQSLKRSLAKDHLSHCYLFTGPPGIGKKHVALWLAYHWLHPEKMSNTVELQDYDDADITWEGPDGTTFKRGQVDGIIANLQKKPFGGRGRAVILDDFHRATVSAQNTLLKTLEEPQVRQLVILVTHDVEKILPTVRSRAQEIKFDPPTPDDYRVIPGMGPDDRLQRLVALHRGAVGPVLADWESGVIPAPPAVITWLANVPNPRAKTYAMTKTLAEDDTGEALEAVGRYLADLLAVEMGLAPIHYPAYHREMQRQMQTHTTSHLQQILEAVDKAQKALDANVNRDLVWENLCLLIEEVFS